MSDTVIELNETNFEREVLRAQEPVVVEFWAGWCQPSKAMAPLLESIAEERAGEVKVAKVNVEYNESLARLYGVRAVPTVLFFKHGGLQDQIIGSATERDLSGKLKTLR